MGKKQSRVYVELENAIYDFLWVDVKNDGSVYIGLTEDGVQGISHIQTNAHILAKQSLFMKLINGKHKISFHQSGRYKTEVPLIHGGVEDRSTTYGPRLADIDKPHLMANIIYPKSFLLGTEKINKHNITVPLIKSDKTHFACSIICMSSTEFVRFEKERYLLIEGAVWNSYKTIMINDKVWCFMLHDMMDPRLMQRYVSISLRGSPPPLGYH